MAKKKKNNSEELKAFLEEVMQDNPEQGKALKLIFRDKAHVFITGKAGSGKTTFMKKMMPFLKNAAIVAPTGIAALNAGGQTIHSFMRLPLDPYIPEVKNNHLVSHLTINGNGDFFKTLQAVKVLIIDEISMVRADLLDKISDVLQSAKRNNEPFGGVRLIMFGDLNQLPPVLTNAEADFYYDYYDTPYFFSSLALRIAGFSVVEFSKIYRQNDPVFVDLLNNVRKGKLTDDDIKLLNSRHCHIPEGFEAVQAVSHNKIAQQVNQSMLDRIKSEPYSFSAVVRGIAPKDSLCEEILTIKVGCQVLMTANGCGGIVGDLSGKTASFVNGSLGIVTNIIPANREVHVKLFDSGHTISVDPFTWENKKYSISEGSLSSNVVGTITQFPIKLGYAMSIHKVQGMTFDKVIVDAGRSFTNGQVYVALSRCRTLENTYLKSPITNDQLIQDDRLLDFYRRSENLGGVFPPEVIDLDEEEELDIFEQFGI